MRESKLTNFQQRQLDKTLKGKYNAQFLKQMLMIIIYIIYTPHELSFVGQTSDHLSNVLQEYRFFFTRGVCGGGGDGSGGLGGVCVQCVCAHVCVYVCMCVCL